MANIDQSPIHEAYEDVRNDSSATTWLRLKYDEKDIVLDTTGEDYADFVSGLTDDERFYGFVRFTSGDEMSKRTKFVFISWLGTNVSPMKKARISTDKTTVKAIIRSFAVEIQTSEKSELVEDSVRDLISKAGGANYGTGSR